MPPNAVARRGSHAMSMRRAGSSAAIAAAIGRGMRQMVQNSRRANFPITNEASGEKDPAKDTLTQYHDIQHIKMKKRKRLTKKAKRRIKRKRKFTKAVRSVVNKSAPMFRIKSISNAIAQFPSFASTWYNAVAQSTYTSNTTSLTLWPGGFWAASPATHELNGWFANTYSYLQERWNTTDLTSANPSNNISARFVNLLVKRWQLDIGLFNNNSTPINVDIYEMVAARDMGETDDYGTVQGAINNIATSCVVLDHSTTSYFQNTMSIRGTTPYDFPDLAKHWKVESKTRVYLPGNGQVSFQCQGRKGIYKFDQMKELGARKGYTKQIMMVAGSEIAFGFSGASNALNFVWNQTIHFKPLGNDFKEFIRQSVYEKY